MPGGAIAYYGPPAEGLAYFGKDRWADVFRAFHAEDGRDWARDFRSSREVVKERGIFRRECAAGHSPGPYLLSKVLVLGVISVVQGLVMTGIGLFGRALPLTGSFLTHDPELELAVTVAVLELASTCLGLVVSTWVKSLDKAIQTILVLTLAQFAFSGGLFTLAAGGTRRASGCSMFA